MSDGGMVEFFVEYAVAAKLLATTVENWIESTNEFIERLEADIPDIEAEFSTEGIKQAVSIELLGDKHDGGRQVMAVTFNDGTKIVYKPRPLEPGIIFDRITSWVESKAPDATDRLTFRRSRKLRCDGYGWMEWIDSEPCESMGDVSRYYQRAGELSCLLYLLNFTDGHLENIVSVRDHPVFLDLETFAQPEGNFSAEGDQTLRGLVQDSVLRTRLLPTYSPDSDLECVGGLATEEAHAQNTKIEVPTFDYVNTDDMELRYEQPDPLVGENLPVLNGETQYPSEHLSDITSGFRRMYEFILDEKDKLLSEDGLIESELTTEVRYLHRATGLYEKTMYPLSSPKYLRDGFLFETHIESLFSLSEMKENENLFELFQLEKSAMHTLDIPQLSIEITDRTLKCAGGRVTDVFEQSPLEQVKSRIRKMGINDLNEQLDYIRLSYQPEPFSHPSLNYSDSNATVTNSYEERLESEVLDIYSRLMEKSKRNAQGDSTWYIHENRHDGAFVHPVIDDLYGGRVGIALFTAAIASNYSISKSREMTEEIVAPIVDKLKQGEKYHDMRVGTGHGLGSLLYGFSKLYEILGNDTYLSAANVVSDLLTPERLEEDELFDVIGGTAGSILALLAWHDISGNSSALDRAITAGDHLLTSRAEDGSGLWYTIQKDNYVTGIAHGMSGIALALGRLFEASGEIRFYEAYLDCMDFERRYFDEAEQCWRDTRTGDEKKYVRGWCSGRAGGILARFETASEATDQVIENALAATSGLDDEDLLSRDHICCGNCGRIEAFLQAGDFLEENEYRTGALRLAANTIDRANKNGRYVTPWSSERWYNPTLFSGEAGVGYSFMRILDPKLPSILAWE
jgi:type 2 lantibiotic biosynthesis protein LanM